MKTKVVMMVVMMMMAGAAALRAQSPLQARIQSLRGTVEIQAPGSSVWQPAVPGQELEQDTLVSTGFKSAALIMVGNSTIQVRPLTRLSLREIRAAAEGDSVDVQLRVGRIRADVRPPAEGGAVNFNVRSPVATASVRGTVFEFDTVNLAVNEGTVSFSGADKTAVYVAAGQGSSPDPLSGRAAAPVEIAVTLTPPPPAGVETVAAPPPAIGPSPPLAVIPDSAQAPVGIGIEWD
jgi:hypothetical protein